MDPDTYRVQAYLRTYRAKRGTPETPPCPTPTPYLTTTYFVANAVGTYTTEPPSKVMGRRSLVGELPLPSPFVSAQRARHEPIARFEHRTGG